MLFLKAAKHEAGCLAIPMFLFSPTNNHWLKRKTNQKRAKTLTDFALPWQNQTYHQISEKRTTCQWCVNFRVTLAHQISLHKATRSHCSMSYKNFTDDSKRESPLSSEFEDDDRTAPLPSGIPLLRMADNNFEGGPSLVSSGSSM